MIYRVSAHSKKEKERQLAEGRGAEGVEKESNRMTAIKAWSSINHSILSASNDAPRI
jgi:hypothetical protein